MQASHRQAYLSNNFHSEITHWKQLCQSIKTRPTYLTEIVQYLATDLGFIDVSGLGTGGVWIDPTLMKNNLSGMYNVPQI